MPRLLAAGMGLGAPGGTCEQVFGAEGNLRTAEDAARTVKQLVAAGADVIKVCAGGGVFFDPNRPAEVELTPALLEAVVSEAHRLGKKVAAHAQGSAAVVNAVNAGVDSIEHGGILSDEAIALMAKRGTAYVPTLARLDWAYKTAQERGAPEQQLSRLLKRRNDAYASARRAFEGGVKIIFGSDASVLPHGRNAMEFRALAEIGLSPQQVIRAATLDAAELLGRDDIGSIRAGAVADLVGFERNPLLDPSVLEQPAWVMRNGVVVFPSK
jgi:imidazolonepropionase-like amidohydrolase